MKSRVSGQEERMRLGKILSELREQRRRIDRAIAVLETLTRQPRQRKRKTHRQKSQSGREMSRLVAQFKATEPPAREHIGGAKVIPFGRSRRRA
jgi:hypothetical protein